MAIVSRRNVESGKIATHPVGTGPFAFQSQKSGDSITLKASPGYWAGVPKGAGVTFRFISEPSTALSALQAGEIGWTDSIPTQRVAQLTDDDSIALAATPSNDYWYLALNEAREPWNDVRVRQAIAYALDRDAIVQATSYGTAVANQLAIPKGNPWHTPYDAYRHDIEKAKSLLSEASQTGIAAPKSLDMLVTIEYPETVTAAQIIADNLAPLGITVNIRTVDFATWLDEQNNGHFDMLMMGWLGNVDPDDFYYAQHHTNGSSNAQKFSNPEVDRLLDAGRVETNRNARADVYAKAATIIADQVSYVYLYNPSARALELLEAVGLPDPQTRLHAYPHQLSGGQRQRVMIAIALACNPELLIADEPTTSLDVTTQAQIIDLVHGLQRDFGTAVVWISHDLGVIGQLADDVAVLRDGEIVEQAPILDVFDEPQNSHTRELLQARPIVGRSAPAPAPHDVPVLLRVDGLDVQFPVTTPVGRSTVHAVKNLSFEVRRGTTLGLVGESGSGKSTVAGALTGLIEPNAGTAQLDGVEVFGVPGAAEKELRRRIGLVFQDPFSSLNPRVRVQTAVDEPLRVHRLAKGKRARQTRVAELLELVGLPAVVRLSLPARTFRWTAAAGEYCACTGSGA